MLEPGTRVTLSDGATVEIVSNPNDGGTYDSPGVLTDRIAEQNQRGFYQRWAACMEEPRP